MKILIHQRRAKPKMLYFKFDEQVEEDWFSSLKVEEPSQDTAQDGEGSTTLHSQCDWECSSIFCAPLFCYGRERWRCGVGDAGQRQSRKRILKDKKENRSWLRYVEIICESVKSPKTAAAILFYFYNAQWNMHVQFALSALFTRYLHNGIPALVFLYLPRL